MAISRHEVLEAAAHQIEHVHSPKQLEALLGSVLASIDIPGYVFVLRMIDEDERIAMSAGAYELCHAYKHRFGLQIDPAMHYARSNSYPKMLSDLPFLSVGQIALRDMVGGTAFEHALVVPAHSGPYRFGVLYCATKHSKGPMASHFWRGLIMTLSGLSATILEWWRSYLHEQTVAGVPIDDIDIQVLNLAVRGFNNTEIADTLDVTKTLIEGRWKRFFRLLDVDNRRAAVQKAAALGMI